MGIRKASKAEIPTWAAADLETSLPGPALTWPKVTAPERVATTCEMIAADTPAAAAAKLIDRLMEEKVL